MPLKPEEQKLCALLSSTLMWLPLQLTDGFGDLSGQRKDLPDCQILHRPHGLTYSRDWFRRQTANGIGIQTHSKCIESFAMFLRSLCTVTPGQVVFKVTSSPS